MNRDDFIGEWTISEVTGSSPEKVGDKITTAPQGEVQVQLSCSHPDHAFPQPADWVVEPGTPGKLVFPRTVAESTYDCTVRLVDSSRPGRRALYCTERRLGDGTDTGSWTADDSIGPWEEG